jgi:hypothetical protein
MRWIRGLRIGGAGGVLAALVFVAGTARAEFSTERPGSIVIFPKVVNADGRDTTIQLANTSNIPRCAVCYYVNGAPSNPNLAPDPVINPPLWQTTDFELCLTRQQPTHWEVSTGRRVDPTDSNTRSGHGESGLDPGAIPPVPSGFTGELVCVEVDDGGAPTSGNSLKGEASISDEDADLAIYNGITIEGFEGNDGDAELNLDNVEYAGCPAGLHFNFPSEGDEDIAINGLGSGSSLVNSTLALVPCSRDFQNVEPSTVGVYFEIRDEFERTFSTSTTVTCWQSLNLDDSALDDAFDLDTPYGYAQLTPTDGDGVGVLGIASIRRADVGTGAIGTAASNLHFIGNEAGSCSSSGDTCGVDGDCPQGETCQGRTNLLGASILVREVED